ncbi:MAG: hypothetical protein IJ447_02140 [Clostridia bacterium]|nr:hypothetical protein [Clostridia bacterium]
MTDEIKKLISDVDKRIEASANQIDQLSQMLNEASVNHQRLIGERAGYSKMLKAMENTTKEGESDADKA